MRVSLVNSRNIGSPIATVDFWDYLQKFGFTDFDLSKLLQHDKSINKEVLLKRISKRFLRTSHTKAITEIISFLTTVIIYVLKTENDIQYDQIYHEPFQLQITSQGIVSWCVFR